MTVGISWDFTASGNGTGQDIFPDKPLQFEARGTFGSGTITLESSLNNGTTWIAIPGISLTATGRPNKLIYAAWGERFRAVLTGATNPVITAQLVQVGA
jgi:hypothetical protein